MACSSCGYKEAGGNFCASCGASLGEVSCGQCGAPASPGARFCASCGTALGAGVAPANGTPQPTTAPPPLARPSIGISPGLLGWGIAGLALLGIALVIGVPRLISGVTDPPPPTAAPFAGGQGAAAGNASSVDLSSMTPREAADRLWDRVVRAAEAGDSVEARTFVPMGIAAYQRVGALDDDGLYHLSVLERIGGDFEGAITTAQQILNTNPNHLLGLHAAGEAALEAGDQDRALGFFQRLVDGFEEEQARALPEYGPDAHGPLLPTILEGAQTVLSGTR